MILKHTPDPNFEMSSANKKLWLACRKTTEGIQKGTLRLPGMFEENITNSLDSIMFLIVVFGELSGIGVLLYLGLTNITGIILVILLIILDFIAAWGAHMNKTRRIEHENNKVMNPSWGPGDIKADKDRLLPTERVFRENLAKSIIIAIAFFKAVGVFALYNDIDALMIFIAFAYSLIAYAHVYHTWYFVTALTLRMRVGSEYSTFTREADFCKTGDYREIYIDGCTQIGDMVSGTFGKHALLYNEEKKCYVLKTWGIFTDEQLSNFISRQGKSAAGQNLANHGREHQINMLPMGATPKPSDK